MDPVSFPASIITLVSTLNTASKGIKNLIDLKHAPEKLLDVQNKVGILTSFFRSKADEKHYRRAKISYSDGKGSGRVLSSNDNNVVFRFERLLMRAKNTAKEAQHLIINRLTKNPESLDKDGVKISVKKRKFLRDEDKLHSISA